MGLGPGCLADVVPELGEHLFGSAVADLDDLCGLSESRVTVFMVRCSAVTREMSLSFWPSETLREENSFSKRNSGWVARLQQLVLLGNLGARWAQLGGWRKDCMADVKSIYY